MIKKRRNKTTARVTFSKLALYLIFVAVLALLNCMFSRAGETVKETAYNNMEVVKEELETED